MSTVSAPLDPSLLGSERPLADKLILQILPDGAGRLDVTLRVVLSADAPEEQAAIDAFAPDGTLDLRYTAELDLDAERNALSAAFAQLYRKSKVSTQLRAAALGKLPLPELREVLMPVAVRGRSVRRRLLEPEQFRNFGQADVPAALAALRSALRREHIVVIKSPVSLFPWAFLYDGEGLNKDNFSTLDVRGFWGFRHQIQEEIEGASARVRFTGDPVIVAAVSPELDEEREHLQGPLGQLGQAAPERVRWIDSAEKLRGALVNFPGDCLYFYGHALQDDPPTPTTSALRIDGLSVTVEEILEARGPMFQRPLVFVFLNGCETAPLNVWNKNSLAGLLCLQGQCRVCCVTSFAEVPAAFGRRFGQRFWARFLQGATMGAALLGARCDLLDEYDNPLGLLYTLFGRAEVRLG